MKHGPEVEPRSLSGFLALSGPIGDASWTHSYSKQCIHMFFCLSPHPITHFPSHLPLPYTGLKLVHTGKISEIHQAASLKVSHISHVAKC